MGPQHPSRRSWGHKEIKQQHYLQMLPGILCKHGACHCLHSPNDFLFLATVLEDTLCRQAHVNLLRKRQYSCYIVACQMEPAFTCSCNLCLHPLDTNTWYLCRES